MKKATSIQDHIKQLVDRATSTLVAYVAQGKLNNEFLSGNQRKKLVGEKIEDKREDKSVYTEKKIFNRMLPIYLTRYGILTQNMPIPGIKPTKPTVKAVSDALVANGFISTLMTDINFKGKVYQQAVKRGDVYGAEWFKTGIDFTAGNKVASINGSVVGDTTGTLNIYEGRPFITNVPINEIFLDNYYVESMDEVNELVHRRIFPIDYIFKRWGIKVEGESLSENKLPGYPKYDGLGTRYSSDMEYAFVYEYYRKSDALYPNGRYVIMCDDKIIWDKELPYENGFDGARQIPFDVMVMQSVPNKLIGITVYSQLIPIQETYNAIKNRYLEYVNHIAIGQLYYWEGSLINKDSFSTKPGKLIGLKRNSKAPQPVQKDKLSMEFINFLRTLEDDMLITAGLSQMAAYGSARSNVRTDGVVDKISESDENKLINALDHVSECLIRSFKKLLYLERYRQKMLEEQLKVANVDEYTKQYDLEEVNIEQLTIVNREFLMQSDQLLDKKLQQAGSLGLYNPQAGLSYQAKLELLDAMHANYLKDTLDVNERATHDLCEDEHAELLDKKVIPNAESWHIHALHITEHNIFRASSPVRVLKLKDPNLYITVQEAITAHVMQHEQMMQQNQKSNVYDDAKAAFQDTAKRPRS